MHLHVCNYIDFVILLLIQFQVRSSIRNCWAHCNVMQWTQGKFVASFQLLESFIKTMGVNAPDENKILGDIHNWKTNGKRKLETEVLIILNIRHAWIYVIFLKCLANGHGSHYILSNLKQTFFYTNIMKMLFFYYPFIIIFKCGKVVEFFLGTAFLFQLRL